MEKPPGDFLTLLDEDISLEETLAFIEDSFEIGGDADDEDGCTSDTTSDHSISTRTDTDSGRPSDTGERRLTPSSLESLSNDALLAQSMRAATRTKTIAAKRHPRKHSKTEVLKLRAQVEELQARFMQLQKVADSEGKQVSHATPKPSPTLRAAATEQPLAKKPRTSHVVASVWLDRAVEQYKELQKSETLNRRLKDALLKQVKLSKTLSTFFQKKASLQNHEFLKEMSPSNESQQAHQLAMPTFRQAEPTDVQRTMEKMYLETDAVCKEICAANDVGSVFSTSQTKHDVVFGPMIELKTNTPVIGDYKELGSLFWGRMMAGSDCKEEVPGTNSQDRKDCHGVGQQKDVKEIMFHVALHSPEVGDVEATGTTAIAKFENDHRTVFAFKSTVAVPGCDLLFHEYGWMVLTDTTPTATEGAAPEAARSPPSVVFQTLYRLHTDLQQGNAMSAGDGAASTVEARKYYQDFVMKSLSNKMRAHYYHIQNLLLVEMEKISTVGLPKKCPHNLSFMDSSDDPNKKT
ncbi:hypothetical protein FI667_g14222, partial [Globisporangium splendens]